MVPGRRDDLAGALADCDAALAAEPNLPAAHLERGLTLLALNRSADAAAALRHCAALAPGTPEAASAAAALQQLQAAGQ